MIQDEAMPDPLADAATQPDPGFAHHLTLNRPIALYGGSRWARFFAGPKTIAILQREITSFENACCLPDGTVTANQPGACTEDAAVFPINAGPGIPLGTFLIAALPRICAATPLWPGAKLAGTVPSPPQHTTLQRLGLLDGYVALEAPRNFRQALQSPAPPPHSTPADDDFLTMMARLRDPAAANVPVCAAILPTIDAQRFILRNRASLSAWLRARRVLLLAPDTDAFDQTAASLARATLVLIADAAQAGLLGLCPPGTRVLEIAAEGWADGTIRGVCAALRLEWQLFLAGPPTYPLSQALPFGARAPLSYEVPIAELGQTLNIL